MDYFKFSGVEFGNWVNQKERAWFLNCTYDSLMDLVELLGLPVTFASLGGKLGIAFGSRGTGVDSAAAHFEPGNMLIHLTKTQGVGALAHEFAHGFDCVLAKRNGLNNNFLANTFFTPVKGVTQYRIIKSQHTNILKMARLQISLSSWLIILLLSQPNTLITKKDKAVRAL